MAEPVDVIAEPTPNPNSVKFTLNRPVSEGRGLSFMDAGQAEASPLAKALFQIPGVKSVFMLNNFITVTRDPEVAWDAIVGEVEAAIKDHYSSQ